MKAGSTLYYLTSGPTIIAEYNGSDNLTAEYIYANGTRYATVIPRSDTYYNGADQIMSSRVLVDANGNLDQKKDYTPYGKGDGRYGALSKYLFSGKSKPGADPDASGEQGAGGLYYFGARYYRSASEIRVSARL